MNKSMKTAKSPGDAATGTFLFPKYLFDKYSLKNALQILPFYSHSGEL